VIVDDGLADGEPHAHAGLLGGVEGIEQVLHALRRDAGPLSRTPTTAHRRSTRVRDASRRSAGGCSSSASRALRTRFSSTCSICTRSTLTGISPSARSCSMLQIELAGLELDEAADLAHQIVEIHHRARRRLLAHQRPQPADDLAGALGLAGDLAHGLHQRLRVPMPFCSRRLAPLA
jgi:hypothetical protein